MSADKEMASLKRTALITIAAIAGAIAGLCLLPISGAVIAPGKVVIETSLRKVQHPTGGTVAALNVREGSRVAKGEVVIRLDETQLKAQLAVIDAEASSLRAKTARLKAEREGSPDVEPEDAEGADPRALKGELKVLQSRREAAGARASQLAERLAQADEEVRGLSDQRDSYQRQLAVASKEIRDLTGLMEKGLIQRPRITALEREVIRLEGAIADTVSKEAQAKGKASEVSLQAGQLKLDLVAEASRELAEVERRIGELRERRVAAVDQLSRVDIRAPESGIVHQLAVHTVGGVIAPGEAAMMIVPEDGDLVVEAMVSPTDVDEVGVGQPAMVRFSAFHSATTPELEGEVTRLSGDVIRDPQTGATYYVAAVRVPKSQAARLGDKRLVPGMPAEAHLKTTERSVGSFLMKPIADQARRAMREG